jgi:hypothetical protein
MSLTEMSRDLKQLIRQLALGVQGQPVLLQQPATLLQHAATMSPK